MWNLNNVASKCTLLLVYGDCHSIDPVIHSLCLLSYLIPHQIKPSHEKLLCMLLPGMPFAFWSNNDIIMLGIMQSS